MRIVLNGQQAFGKAVLDALLERGDEVVAVYTGPEQPGQRPDPLAEAAAERGLPLYRPKSFKTAAVAEEFRAWRADLCVMAYVTLLVPEAILNAPTHGTIQYHPSLLPKHRGPSSINWPIIQGETKTGLSIFWPDEGLDTGPILVQKEVAIGPDDTLGSLYFDQLFPLGVAGMLEGVDLVAAGDPPRIAQDESRATYEGWCTKEVARIDWGKPVSEVYNLIRGTNPQPGAWCELRGEALQIFDARKTDATGTPGEVLEADETGFAVAAGGGAVAVERARPAGGKKQAAGELVSSGLIELGTRLT